MSGVCKSDPTRTEVHDVRPKRPQDWQPNHRAGVLTEQIGRSGQTGEYRNTHRSPAHRGSQHNRGPRRRLWAILVPIVAIAATVAATTANGSVRRLINYKVTTPITVQALGVDLDRPQPGQVVTAGAKLVAARQTTLRSLAILARDKAGNNYDFPHVAKFVLGTQQKEFTTRRAFDKPGTYTYWVAYLTKGSWTSVGPRQTFTVGEPQSSTPTPSPTTVSPSAQPSPSPSASASPTATSEPPTQTSGGFPGAGNTGVPAGVTLTDYTGPCTIGTNGTVIDAKTVNCDLSIRATGVVIKRSRINGEINGDEGTGSSFTVEDSEVVNQARRACQCIGSDNFTVRRTEIRGGNRGIYCRLHCLVVDSWIHGSQLLETQHASAVRVEQYATLRHNTLACTWTGPLANDTGCSADLAGYPDFAPITHNTITGNLFAANPSGAGFCAYGGATQGKPYSGSPTNATYIVFADNVWQRGSNGKCGTYGPIVNFDKTRTGNQWTNNRFDDGTVIPPEN
jgi:hypothetical protein